MAYVPAKMIESVLKKEGIEVDGYSLIDWIDDDWMKESERLGMEDGITREFEFSSKYPLEDGKITFYGKMCEDYREISPDEEVKFYFTQLDSCKIKRNGEKKYITMNIYWK